MDWAAIEAVLPAGWRQLAVDMKVIRPNLAPQLGAKVTDIGVILRLVLYQVAKNCGLEFATAMFAAAGLLAISFVALHKWMKKLGPYLAELLAQMVRDEQAMFAPERWAGYEMVLLDASAVMRPGAKTTTSRVHYALRLTDLGVVEAHVTDEKGGETLRRFRPEPGQLWIGDRGYANPPGISHAVDRGADVLIRYNRGSLPLYDVAGRAIDVQNKLSKLRNAGRPRQWSAWIHVDGERRLAGRLCAVRLPADKAEEARTRARREQGTEVTAQTLAMAEFVVVFTTVPRDRLTCDMLLVLYRARWQVELAFKRSKSITGLDRLPNFRSDTIQSWVCGKLLLHQIARRLSLRESAGNGAFPPRARRRPARRAARAVADRPPRSRLPRSHGASAPGTSRVCSGAWSSPSCFRLRLRRSPTSWHASLRICAGPTPPAAPDRWTDSVS